MKKIKKWLLGGIFALSVLIIVACSNDTTDTIQQGTEQQHTTTNEPNEANIIADPPERDNVIVETQPQQNVIVLENIGSWAGTTPTPPATMEVTTSLRVETTGGQQWDGTQIPIAALGLQEGNIYHFSVDIFTPVTPGNVPVALLVQTNGPLWRHIIPMPTFTDIGTNNPEWTTFTGELDLNDIATMPTHIQIVKRGGAPNAEANIIFHLDNFIITHEGKEIVNFTFESGNTAPFVSSGQAIVSTASVMQEQISYNLTFETANYNSMLSSGAQVAVERVRGHGQNDDYSLRVTNVTGDWNSGQGNYVRIHFPEPLPMGGTYQLSWWVYIPEEYNPNRANIPGMGIVFNGSFGSPAHQPTNARDLTSTTPMGRWVQTALEFTADHSTGAINHITFRFRVNDMERQPAVWFIDNISISTLGIGEVIIPEWDMTLPSLYERFSNYFLFGNILEPHLINTNPSNVIEMFLRHYNSLTAENAMKPDAISGGGNQRTRPSALNLANAERMVSFAEEHGLYMVGHTLIWHEQSAPWLYRHPETNEPLTRAEAMENMRWFIEHYAGHFEGRIHAWDVTNEVFTTGGSANVPSASPEGSPVYETGTWQRTLRNYVPWYHAFANGADFAAGERGYDYIYYAFVFARRYAPSALLIYNDFNEEAPGKRDGIANMVEDLNERWANDSVNNPAYGNPNHQDYGRLLIEVIGMQSHYSHNTNMAHVRQAIERFAATGARIHVTELDIQFPGIMPAPFTMTDAQMQRQADMFAQLFVWYMEFSDYIDRVTIWGREDGSSWRGATGATHFDRFFRPKPSFWAILDPVGWLED